MVKRVLILTGFCFLVSQESVQALVCSSPKKSAATAPKNQLSQTELGISNFYRYAPYSNDLTITPMLKRGHINLLRNNQNPEVCQLPVSGCEHQSEVQCCPAKMIKKTVTDRGQGGYWLIFNEPHGEDGYGQNGGAWQAADDAAFAISFIKQHDPQAKFILGWFTNIQNSWPSRAPVYGLNTEINQEIAGWHVHLYGTSVAGFEATDVVHHPVRQISPGKEFWITEFGTLGGTDCRYDSLEASNNCVNYMKGLLNWLENSNLVDQYFWWNYGPCRPECASGGGCQQWERDMCWGPLIKKDNQGNVVLNNLGKAFAEIPNDNGVCRDSDIPASTPSPGQPSATNTPGASPSPGLSPSPTEETKLFLKVNFQSLGQTYQPKIIALLKAEGTNFSKTILLSQENQGINLENLAPGNSYNLILSCPTFLRMKQSIEIKNGRNPTSGFQEFGPAKAGDLNLDNQINSLDWSLMKLNFGDSGEE